MLHLPKLPLRWLVGLLLLLAFVLRVWNIDFGLPYLYHPDEPRYINVAIYLFQTGDINPNSITELSINSFSYVLNAVAYGGYYWVGHLFGVFDSPQAIAPLEMITMASGQAPLPALVLYSRLITALFGVGAVYLLYLTGRAFAQSEVVGLLAGLFMAVSPGNVVHSKFVIGDEILVFFVCIALWTTLKIVERSKVSDYLIAGATVGFALSVKLTGAIVLLPMALAHLWRYRLRSFHQPNLYLAAVAALIAFVLTTPFILVDPMKVVADWQFESSHYASSHAGMEGDTLLWYENYLWGIEGPVVGLGIGGLLIGLFRKTKLTVMLGSLLVCYVLIIGGIPVRNDRTILPITPILFLFAAYGLYAAWLMVAARLTPFPRRVAYIALVGVIGIAIGWPLVQTIEKNIMLGSADGRALAQAWLPEHLPKGAKVAVEAYSPFVDPALYTVQGFYRIIDHPIEWYVEQGFNYVVLSQGMYGRFLREPQLYPVEVASYQAFFDAFELVQQFEDPSYSITYVDNGYEIRVYKVVGAR